MGVDSGVWETIPQVLGGSVSEIQMKYAVVWTSRGSGILSECRVLYVYQCPTVVISSKKP